MLRGHHLQVIPLIVDHFKFSHVKLLDSTFFKCNDGPVQISWCCIDSDCSVFLLLHHRLQHLLQEAIRRWHLHHHQQKLQHLFLSNMNYTNQMHPCSPLFLPKAERTLAAVRFTFEVSVSTINIEPFGPKPS